MFRSFEKKKEKKKRRMNFKRISFSISKDLHDSVCMESVVGHDSKYSIRPRYLAC